MNIRLILCIISLCFLQSCKMSKMGLWAISDYHRFPKFKRASIENCSGECFQFAENPKYNELISNITYYPPKLNKKQLDPQTLGEFLDKNTSTTAFLVIRNDTILYENYFGKFDENSSLTSYSIAKSFTSALIGIAVDEGLIQSIEDPVTKYLDYLKGKHPYWEELTINHLLHMQSGIEHDEWSYMNPNKDLPNLVFSKDVSKVISRQGFKEKPGTSRAYSSVDSQVLGLILEKVTGKLLAEYLEEKIWTPLGMESDASWSLDSKKHQNTKAYCCIQATARDFAKFGRLYANNGKWQGNQIVPEDWVKKSMTPRFDNKCYQYNWYSNDLHPVFNNKDGSVFFQKFTDSLEAVKHFENEYQFVKKTMSDEYVIRQCGPGFYAAGVFEQRVFVNPETNMVFVRLGKKRDIRNEYTFKLIEYALNNMD